MSETRYSIDQLQQAIQNSFSWRAVCKNLGYYPDNANYQKIRKVAEGNKISFSHFLGKAIWKGKISCNRKDPKYLLKIDKKYVSSHGLKNRLVRDGYKKHQCEKCKNIEWNGELIPIELHHVNGNRKDNRLENLQILCPNCHAQTPNYCSRNKKY